MWFQMVLISLLFDPECGGVADAPRVRLRLAAVPQVDDGIVDVEQEHGRSGAQAAAVAGHLQQVAFHGHFTTHAVEAPVTWEQTGMLVRFLRALKDAGVRVCLL